MRILVQMSGLQVPQKCACCLRPATTTFGVSISKSQRGLTQTTVHTRTWEFPACEDCRKHVNMGRTGGGVGCVTGMMATFLVPYYLGVKAGEDTFYALVIGAVLTILLAAGLKLLLGAGGKACKSGFHDPVRASGPDGSGRLTFTFANETYGRMFLQANPGSNLKH